MSLLRANKKEDGYCQACHQDVDPEKLVQCERCKDWFCEKHIALVEDPDSIEPGKMVNFCEKDQGKAVVF